MKIILKDKGIEVFDAPPSLWNVHQDVVDDITKELELESKYPPKKQKGYETLRHDIVLWHVVELRRNKPETSPIDTEIWAVSIDWRLIGFDQRKRKISNSTVPAVIYPTNLVQLLQFWVPRSENLESTMIDSLQLPLFFQKFDKDDETATLKILETLSRFENHNDISTESAAKILKNRSLRKRIQESDFDTEKTISLIREELLAENEKANTHISHLENRILLEKKERENEKTAHKKQLLDEKEKNLKAIQQQKEKSEIQADKKFSAYKKYLITGITIYYLSILGLTLHYGWDIAEMYTWISSIAPIFIGLIYQVNQEKPFDLIALFDKKRENLLNNQYIENRFSIFEYEKLIEEINLIKQELKP